MKPKHVPLAILFASGVCFIWGIETHRTQMFPYPMLKSVYDLFKPAPTRTTIQSRSRALDRLSTLGYVGATFDPDHHLRSVTTHDSSRAFPGLNFYSSRWGRSAFLIDMDGEVVHEWSHDTPDTWQSVQLLPDGDVLVIEQDTELVRLDSRSQLLWRFEGRVHHDLDVFDDRIYVLNRIERFDQTIHSKRRTIDDVLSVLTPEGVEIEQISILNMLRESPYAYLLLSLAPDLQEEDGPPLDILHTNHVEVIRETVLEGSPALKRGNLILSVRNINAVMVVDPTTLEIVWLWGPGNLTFQHHPSLLANGNLLIFDNGIERSRIIELDPVSLRIVWSYASDDFFSKTRGSAQRLPNGNSLVTESDTGYVFEVDASGNVVWQFVNPDVDELGNRAPIWRMMRFSNDHLSFIPASGVPDITGTVQ